MNRKKYAISRFVRTAAAVAPVAVVVLLSDSAAWAAEAHGPRWDDFAWRVLNFVLFAGILWYFIGGKAKQFFRNRREGISSELDSLDARRKSAREELDKVEQRIRNLEAERRAILDESREQAESLKQAIIDEARAQATQIVEQARRSAENEGRAVIAEVRATIADEIVAATEKALAKKLGPAEQEALIDKSLNKVVLH